MKIAATWIQTYSGVAFDLANPRPEMVRIEDIAHSLATLNRYTGHAAWPYSIGQHSLMVAEIVAATAPELALAAMLHDSPETYTNDLSSPIKWMMRQREDAGPEDNGQVFLELEDSIERVIHQRFAIKLDAAARRLIKHADLVALATEKRDLFGPPPRTGWGDATGFTLPPPLEQKCTRMRWDFIESLFLAAFDRYGGVR